MKIGSLSENKNLEKRIAITPDIIKKYNSIGIEVCLSENYGSHLGIKDEQFKDMGVKISKPIELYFLTISGVIATLFSRSLFSEKEIIFIKLF